VIRPATGVVHALEIRKRLGPATWSAPRAIGGDSFQFAARHGLIVVSGLAEEEETGEMRDWIHASMSRPDGVPSYDDLVHLHQAVWPGGHAYHVFVPPEEHININARVLHLWGRADGTRVLPDFGIFGTI